MMPEMVRVEGRWFLMGSNDGRDDERPVHRVRLDTFEIGSRQVTNAEYAAFLAATGEAPPPCWNDPRFSSPAQPVVAVSWFDAVRYCEWLGAAFRLPTEAEWECAARGGVEGRTYPWGDEARAGEASRWQSGPEPVGRGEPNGFGLYDVCENVHEWCSDWYSNDYYSCAPEANPSGPHEGVRCASRGGSWRHQIKISRCAARSSIPPEFRYADYGFRVARSG